ncbi:hypothetical protein HCG60_09160 [Ligilactobacillus murinus]|uniref:hypothetical protein n=1 Tax=Ligilactobacillus murinus TaxID=1622 RepID=UPI001C8CC13B|nr:hypothetical protein [Ligilactobacillus murinus]MBX9013192.1 hypothetical protein [Ligilactobacillus murinus]
MVEREMETVKMSFNGARVFCESCGEEITAGQYIELNPECFGSFWDYGWCTFCDSVCLAIFLESNGVVNRIYRKEVNEYED